MKKASPALKQSLIESIKNQIKENNPPETKQTYFRLLSEGFSEEEVYIYLTQALAYEMFAIMKKPRNYDSANYIELLSKLPHLD